jgi:septal ring factor EnvC (AmiA/AmiB activator)
LVALAAAVATAATAQDSLETAKRQELEQIRRQAQEKREAARRLLGRETHEIGQLRRTERQLNLTRKRLRALKQRQSSLGHQLENTEADIRRSSLTLQQQKTRLARRLRSLYKYGPEHRLEVLLSTQSFAQLLARWDGLVMVAEQDRMLVEDVQAQKSLVEADKQRLVTNLSELARTAKRTDRENSRLAQLRQSKATTVQEIQSERQAYEGAAAELEKTARSIQRLLAQLERKRREESEHAREEGRNPQPYTGDFAKGEGQLQWPVRGDIIGHFGPETHPRWGTVTMNNGIDIATEIGTPVRSVARGRVDYVSEDFGTYGQIVVLNHGDGYYTLYGHLSQISVAVGQEVTPGQTLGRSGDTGSLKGPELHFEVRKGAQSLNPQDWLQ